MKRETLIKRLNFALPNWPADDGCWLNSSRKSGKLSQYRFEIDEEDETLTIDWNRTLLVEVKYERILSVEINFAGYLEIRTEQGTLIHALVPEIEKEGKK